MKHLVGVEARVATVRESGSRWGIKIEWNVCLVESEDDLWESKERYQGWPGLAMFFSSLEVQLGELWNIRELLSGKIHNLVN